MSLITGKENCAFVTMRNEAGDEIKVHGDDATIAAFEGIGYTFYAEYGPKGEEVFEEEVEGEGKGEGEGEGE